jgi:hypothetical protein
MMVVNLAVLSEKALVGNWGALTAAKKAPQWVGEMVYKLDMKTVAVKALMMVVKKEIERVLLTVGKKDFLRVELLVI